MMNEENCERFSFDKNLTFLQACEREREREQLEMSGLDWLRFIEWLCGMKKHFYGSELFWGIFECEKSSL